MGCEYSRLRFQPDKHFASVVLQQGRVNGSTTAAERSSTPSEVVPAKSNEPEFRKGDHLEVIDRVAIVKRRPGAFLRVERVDGDRLAVAPVGEPQRDDLIDPMVRLWDADPVPVRQIGRGPITLGDGLEVQFDGSRFQGGDYWLIAVRTADGSLARPDAEPASDPQPPHGIVRRCPIAPLRRDKVGWSVVRDLRSSSLSLSTGSGWLGNQRG